MLDDFGRSSTLKVLIKTAVAMAALMVILSLSAQVGRCVGGCPVIDVLARSAQIAELSAGATIGVGAVLTLVREGPLGIEIFLGGTIALLGSLLAASIL